MSLPLPSAASCRPTSLSRSLTGSLALDRAAAPPLEIGEGQLPYISEESWPSFYHQWWSCRELHPGPRSAWQRHYKLSELFIFTWNQLFAAYSRFSLAAVRSFREGALGNLACIFDAYSPLTGEVGGKRPSEDGSSLLFRQRERGYRQL